MFSDEVPDANKSWPLTVSLNDNELANADQPTHWNSFYALKTKQLRYIFGIFLSNKKFTNF